MRLAVLLVLVVLPAASAQDAVYATNQGSGGTANISYAASQDAPAAGKAYAAFAQGGLSYSTTFAGTLARDYEPGLWELRLLLSCDRATLYRPTTTTDVYRPTVTSTLSVAGTALPAVHGESTLRTCDGPSDVWELAWQVDGSGVNPTAGSAVSWVTNIWWLNPPPGAAQNGYFAIGPEGTGLFGLVPAAVDEPVTRILVNETLVDRFEQTFGQSINATYTLHANVTADHDLQFNITNQAGAATIRVNGSSELHNETSTDGHNATVALGPGNWTITLDLDAYVGTVQVLLSPATGPVDGGPDGNTTTDGPTPDDESPASEDTPHLPLVAVIALLALAARRSSAS